MRFFVNVHEKNGRRVLAVCDEELLGKVLEEDEICLDLEKYKGFYAGELKDEQELRNLLKETSSFESLNLVGNRSVKIAMCLGIVDEEDVIIIDGQMHVQIYML
jgi:hypothetical protein